MVRPERGAAVARMVELRGVEAAFPFYGTLVARRTARAYSHDLLEDDGALVRPELLAQLGVQVGDRLLIGGQPFTIRGVIDQEPGRRVGGFSLGLARAGRSRPTSGRPASSPSAAARATRCC